MYMVCKICDKKVKGNIGLSRHLKFEHSLKLLDYKIRYDGYVIPKCPVCGENRKYKDGLRFCYSCGIDVCVKSIQRMKRIQFMKENPNETAWRRSNMSYPEKIFMECLIDRGLDKKFLIVREKSVFPYFIDFAFIHEKVAIEIDGSQHLLKERMNNDIEKDKCLNDLGWGVYRITVKTLLENPNKIIDDIISYLGDGCCDNKSVGIHNHTSVKHKRKSLEEIKEVIKIVSNKQRRVERPTYKQLVKETNELGYCGTGRKYGVSDNAIRKWLKYYEKYEQ